MKTRIEEAANKWARLNIKSNGDNDRLTMSDCFIAGAEFMQSEVERIKEIARDNYDRAEEINRIRTEEIKKLKDAGDA